MNKERKELPHFMSVILYALKNTNDLRHAKISSRQIVDKLIAKYKIPREKALDIIKAYIDEGVLIGGLGFLGLPELDDIPMNSHDYYCFECHLPGELIACTNYARAFHQHCERENPERSKYKLNIKGVEQNFYNCQDYTIELVNTPSQNSASVNVNQAEISFAIPEIDIKGESEVVFVGQVRSPTRQRDVSRNNENCKLEIPEEISINKNNICTCCRLMEIAEIRQPPNLDRQQLSYLLAFSFGNFSVNIHV